MKKSVLLLPLVTLMTLAGCGSKESTTTDAGVSGNASSGTSENETAYTVTISGDSTMYLGRSQTLTASVSVDGVVDSSIGVSWSVDDESIVTVDIDSGLVTALAIGKTTVTAMMMNEPYEIGTFEITVTTPDLDKSLYPIKDNYTLYMECPLINNATACVMVDDKEAYKYGSGGWFTDGYARETILWFADDKVYPVEVADDKGEELYYYDGEYLTDTNDNPYTKDAILATFDGSDALTNTDITYFAYASTTGYDYYITTPKTGESIDALTSFVVSMSYFNSVDTVINAYKTVSETPISILIPIAAVDEDTGEIDYHLVGEICGLTADGKVDLNYVALNYEFYDFGTSSLGINPTMKYFHDGGEAGDGDGEGEDFDGGKDDSDGDDETTATDSSTGDGE